MSLYIKGVNLPEQGVKTLLVWYNGDVTDGQAQDIGKAVEVPPHGRCVDADALNTRERGNNSQRIMWSNIRQIVAEADTIIPADPEEGEA